MTVTVTLAYVHGLSFESSHNLILCCAGGSLVPSALQTAPAFTFSKALAARTPKAWGRPCSALQPHA